jgi:hypothetical protein
MEPHPVQTSWRKVHREVLATPTALRRACIQVRAGAASVGSSSTLVVGCLDICGSRDLFAPVAESFTISTYEIRKVSTDHAHRSHAGRHRYLAHCFVHRRNGRRNLPLRRCWYLKQSAPAEVLGKYKYRLMLHHGIQNVGQTFRFISVLKVDARIVKFGTEHPIFTS